MDHQNVHFSSGNYETRSSKPADENAKFRVEFERSYSYLRLVAACSKIARTSVKVRKIKRLPLVLLRAQKRISEQVLYWPLVRSLRWDDRRTSVTTLHVSVVWAIEHFNKNKASHHKQRQFNCCFLSLFYFLSIISAFVANMSFIEALFRLRICLFRYVVCRRESSKTCYFRDRSLFTGGGGSLLFELHFGESRFKKNLSEGRATIFWDYKYLPQVFELRVLLI